MSTVAEGLAPGLQQKPDTGGVKTDPLYVFNLRRNVLLALQLFQSEDGTRKMIACTHFELRGNALTLIATDGHRIATWDDHVYADSPMAAVLPEKDEFSIDLDGVNKLPKVTGENAGQVTVYVFEKHVEIQAGDHIYRARKVTEIFPKWRGLFPADIAVGTFNVCVNQTLLSTFGRAAKLLAPNSDGMMFTFRGADRPIEIALYGCREFRGMLMPMRVSAKPSVSSASIATETASGTKGPEPK